jgi:hypothetical protein
MKAKHEHKLFHAYKKDQGVPVNQAYNKAPRWLVGWACKCGHFEATDLTYYEPVKRGNHGN